MKTFRLIIGFTLLSLECSAASLAVKIEPSAQRTARSSFDEDHLDIVLRDGTNVLDRVYLNSSYGKAEAQLIADAIGTRYGVVRYGQGRGTHVREEFIKIFRVGKRLNEMVSFPLSGPAGDSADWQYSYRVDRPKNGGLKFVLSLRVTGKRAIVFPEDKSRTISIE